MNNGGSAFDRAAGGDCVDSGSHGDGDNDGGSGGDGGGDGGSGSDDGKEEEEEEETNSETNKYLLSTNYKTSLGLPGSMQR